MIRTSEIFTSIEGEGPFSGQPMIFVRLYGCNFSCEGFSNPEPGTHIDYTSFKGIKVLADTPPLTKGCDSAYSWALEWEHLATEWDKTDLAHKINDMCNETGVDIVCFTGGEPTIQQKELARMLEYFDGFREERGDPPVRILFETNASVRYSEVFSQVLTDYRGGVYFANSPKLRNSGEKYEKACVPEVIVEQTYILMNRQSRSLYALTDPDTRIFKFVHDGTPETMEEIHFFLKTYQEHLFTKFDSRWETDISRKSIYLMPLGADEHQQMEIAQKVAADCIKNNFIYCHRVHVSVYGNVTGT